MRWVLCSLAGLFVLIQYPLWLGKGGWLRAWEIDQQVRAQRQSNAKLELRNRALEGEVRDLKQGLVALEERARYELGMVRPDEIFVQINPSGAVPSSSLPRAPALPQLRGEASDMRAALR
jgi:cell division protein FtsB